MTSAPSIRRAGLSLVPFAAILVTVVAAVIYGLTIPSSSPPSQDDVTSAAILVWLLSIVFLFVSAVWASTVSTGVRGAVAVCITLCLVAVGSWVSRVLDRSSVDACDFGTGSGDRCIAGGGTPDSGTIGLADVRFARRRTLCRCRGHSPPLRGRVSVDIPVIERAHTPIIPVVGSRAGESRALSADGYVELHAAQQCKSLCGTMRCGR